MSREAMRGVALRLGRPVDPGAVLRADVVALAHALGRVVALPEDLEHLLVARLRRVEDGEHDLVVAGAAGADLLVRRVRREAARVADGGGVDAGRLPEHALGAPEAAHPEDRSLGAFGEGRAERRAEDEVRPWSHDGVSRPGSASSGVGISVGLRVNSMGTSVAAGLTARPSRSTSTSGIPR